MNCASLTLLRFCVSFRTYPEWDYRSVLKCSRYAPGGTCKTC